MDLSEWDRWFGWRRKWPFFKEIEDLFREMEEMIEREFRELSERTPRDLIREKVLSDGSKVREFGPFVYGYSIKIGPDGRPEIREFGNIKPGVSFGRPRVDIMEEREPLTDVITTDGEVKVIAELPGVEKKDIKLHCTEDTLTISVDVPQRKYYKKVELPVKVEPKKAKASYKNGVLEVTLKKKEEPEGEPIKL
ncbi:Hsp20/alpha crystallin family protein [Candidatus Bathyarchaeota archaeon]|nr:MAG: heat-shock protein Hsp20 [Candidatus Bathyarchaeota archaeon ex4484_40]RJS79425.1 MAG: Hsp20/alpha crystallin family protein [Candidatus Bathyarchaeota archaeon]RLG93639.1 MAG: Hsp20/alpha crystallin family protein [Candidatus Bathyarchaeota archaeon]